MKNLKISVKLIIGFLTVIVLSVVVGLVGILGMYRMNVADDKLYNGNYLPTIMAGEISQCVVEQRVYMRNFVIYDVNENSDIFKSAEENMEASKKRMEELFSEYEPTIILQEDQDAFDEFRKVYNEEWVPVLDEVHEHGMNNETQEAEEALTSGIAAADKMNELATQLQDINMADGKSTVEGNTSLFTTMTIVEVLVLTFSVILALSLAFYISRLISKPVGFMKDVLLRIGTKGNLAFTNEEFRQIEDYAAAKDEVGESVGMLLTTVRHLVQIGDGLGSVANGDLTNDVNLLSEQDTMGQSLKKMNGNLNNMFGDISSSTSQVSEGSKQIADSSQSLAQGTTEQAAAVEELSSSIAEIAEKTKDNAKMAGEAATLADTIMDNAERGSKQMEQLTSAVSEINEASQSISKIIGVIDNIAFQTNILALNASVEAARAGQHGKGFAVVAEEVRALATKSAEAAKETGGMIANSLEKAELGAKISGETAVSLAEIVKGIEESNQLVGQIAKSSEEQSNGITQINKGIDQIAKVIQQNSAMAEQSAAASEEMSGQAIMLEELMSQFKLKKSNMAQRISASTPSTPAAQLAAPYSEDDMVNVGGDGAGKY